jgi:hypothetical protein
MKPVRTGSTAGFGFVKTGTRQDTDVRPKKRDSIERLSQSDSAPKGQTHGAQEHMTGGSMNGV